jgi:hypothetical protein
LKIRFLRVRRPATIRHILEIQISTELNWRRTMLPPSITTEELRLLIDYSKAGIVSLEQQGIIQRDARDTWPIPSTLIKLVGHLRAKIRQGQSPEDARWRAARARELELRIAQRENKLISIDEANGALENLIGLCLTELSGLPAAVTRDLAIRQAIEKQIFVMRKRIAERLEQQARSLGEHGRAAA